MQRNVPVIGVLYRLKREEMMLDAGASRYYILPAGSLGLVISIETDDAWTVVAATGSSTINKILIFVDGRIFQLNIVESVTKEWRHMWRPA